VQAAPGDARVPLRADKGYDAAKFIEALQEMQVAPHLAWGTSGRHRSSSTPNA